jgi:hypothetical protein
MTDVRTALQSAFANGSPAAVTIDDLLAEGGYGPESWLVVVDVPLDASQTWNITNLFSALGVSSHETLGTVPAALSGNLPTLSDKLTLTRASFLVVPATRAIASITLAGALPTAKAGLSVGGVKIVNQRARPYH